MDEDLKRLIRERYPFPIAHAHKKTLACLNDDVQKLKCVIQTAETVIQFLALVMLAQLHRDLEHQQASALSSQGEHLRDDLRHPSFGKWHGILRDVLKQYHLQCHLLVMPELFDFYFQPARGKTLRLQTVVTQAIEPLMALRNRFHHPGIPDHQIPEAIAAGLLWLEQVLAGLRFLSTYQMAFVQDIRVHYPAQTTPVYSHELLQMGGCFSTFDRQRWDSEAYLVPSGCMILLATDIAHPYLLLDPFITCAEQLPVAGDFVLAQGVFEVFLLNAAEPRRARYLAAQSGLELRTDHPPWVLGTERLKALGAFFDRLRCVPTAEVEVALESDDPRPASALEVESPISTAAVYATQYQRASATKQFVSPYKFLDYFEPEDADLFCGREQESRELQRKFHRARLLILHGESGVGKTSLIRAGLIPQLAPESYVPVYVRVLQEPTQAIKEEMVRQLGVDRRSLDLPLAQFLDTETAHLSKTVVLVLDQFEEFFLRFPLEVRQLFHRQLGACMAAAHLDVHVLMALREDYFSRLAEFQDVIPDIFTHEMRLTRLTQAQALAAAVEPVKRVGLTIDEALVAEVLLPQLDDAGHGIEPPLLQIVCDALYQHAQDAGRTTIGTEDYAAIGDVRGALGQYVERTLRQFGPAQPQVRAVLKALVTAESTKRAAFVEELVSRLQTMGLQVTAEAVTHDFLDKLVQARLVRVEEAEGHTRYELAHEYLVQQIAVWIAENERELTKVLELIDRAYAAYRTTGLLLPLEALALIAPFQDVLVLPPEQQQFLTQSRQTARQKRRGLWLKVATLLLAVALGFSLVLVGQSAQKQRQLREEKAEADRQRQQAQDRLVALYREQGRRALLNENNAWRAAVYLSQAYQEGDRGPALRFLLAQAMQPFNALRAILIGHTDRVYSPAFSPDGTRLVTASADGTARVWDARRVPSSLP